MDEMTDKQFLHHLRELLALMKRCKTLEEAIKALEDLIAHYEQ